MHVSWEREEVMDRWTKVLWFMAALNFASAALNACFLPNNAPFMVLNLCVGAWLTVQAYVTGDDIG